MIKDALDSESDDVLMFGEELRRDPWRMAQMEWNLGLTMGWSQRTGRGNPTHADSTVPTRPGVSLDDHKAASLQKANLIEPVRATSKPALVGLHAH